MTTILSNPKNRLLFSLLSGILMVLAFPYTGSVTPLIFISWIPSLLVEQYLTRHNYHAANFFIHGYITFLVYNVGTTWWIWNASQGGALLAFLLNSLLMTIPYHLFHLTKKKLGDIIGYVSLFIFWITFEYLHFHWELSWPWLTIGNNFSITPTIIQWYSYTGVLGGTLWVLLVNYSGLQLLFSLEEKKSKAQILKVLIIFLSLIILPVSVSGFIYKQAIGRIEKQHDLNVVLLQPNIDPYNEKFISSLDNQLKKLCDLADKHINYKTDIIIAPETAISTSFWEEDLDMSGFYHYLIQRKKKWKNASFFTGASTLRFYDKIHSRASKKLVNAHGFYESYNSSLLIDELGKNSFLHKSKLVLGVEKVPFSDWLPFLEELSINNGGTSGTLGIEKEPHILKSHKVTFAPLICYESVYGEFNAEQCRKGAQAIFIITNDGWWGDTPGYKQHKSFACLRAIENRKFVARSANTGTSCFINEFGEIIQETPWWKMTAIRHAIKLNSNQTFYTRNGDLLGKNSSVVSVFLLVGLILSFFNVGKKSYFKSFKNPNRSFEP